MSFSTTCLNFCIRVYVNNFITVTLSQPMTMVCVFHISLKCEKECSSTCTQNLFFWNKTNHIYCQSEVWAKVGAVADPGGSLVIKQTLLIQATSLHASSKLKHWISKFLLSQSSSSGHSQLFTTWCWTCVTHNSLRLLNRSAVGIKVLTGRNSQWIYLISNPSMTMATPLDHSLRLYHESCWRNQYCSWHVCPM